MYLQVQLTLMRTEKEMLGNHTWRKVQADQRSSLFPVNPEKKGGVMLSQEKSLRSVTLKIQKATMFMSKQLRYREEVEEMVT